MDCMSESLPKSPMSQNVWKHWVIFEASEIHVCAKLQVLRVLNISDREVSLG